MYPRIICDLAKLEHNTRYLVNKARAIGMECGFITKCVCGHEPVIRMLEHTPAEFIGDSRIQNLSLVKAKKHYLIRTPMLSEIFDVARFSDMSAHSDVATVAKLGYILDKTELTRPHLVVIMIDLGDLREGIFFENEIELYKIIEEVRKWRNLSLYGIGTNLTCFGGILPDDNNLGKLVEIANRIRTRFDVELPMVSGGNSSSVSLMLNNTMPKGITSLRVGEAWLLGRDTMSGEPIEGLHQDCFTLEAELIEVKTKPSKPIGTSGMNAFGEYVTFEDQGLMRRGIIALGRQDVVAEGLTPLDDSVEVLGASSDHLIVNLNNSDKKIGDILRFAPDYGALLRLYTSPYVKRVDINVKYDNSLMAQPPAHTLL